MGSVKLASIASPLLPHRELVFRFLIKMVVPDSVMEKVGALPDVSAMSKDDLAALCKQLYDQSCTVFGEKFRMEYQVKKRDLEIQTSESHGTFKIPKLKKVNKFKMMGEEES